jgi:hypothetical protein
MAECNHERVFNASRSKSLGQRRGRRETLLFVPKRCCRNVVPEFGNRAPRAGSRLQSATHPGRCPELSQEFNIHHMRPKCDFVGRQRALEMPKDAYTTCVHISPMKGRRVRFRGKASDLLEDRARWEATSIKD